MFEATLDDGQIMKQIIEALKDLITDANIDISPEELSIQCMDSSHVALVDVNLNSSAFSKFRCDKPMSLGFNGPNFSKILKLMNKDDTLVMKAEDDGDSLTLMFENDDDAKTIADFGTLLLIRKPRLLCCCSIVLSSCRGTATSVFSFFPLPSPHSEKTRSHTPFCPSHYRFALLYMLCYAELKLMDISSDQMGIPDTPYKCIIKMPSGEFQRIVRDLQVLGDTCSIAVSKEGVRFSVSGEMGTGNIITRANAAAEKESDQVVIDMEEPVDLNFALRYLNFFTKATPLSNQVILHMSPELPILVEYPIGDAHGSLKFFLAPKIDDEDDAQQ